MVEVELKPLLKKLNRFCTRSLEAAAGVCISRTHYEVSVEHALLKMAEDPKSDLAQILLHYDADPGRFLRDLQRAVDDLRAGNAGKPVFSPMLVEWVQDAWLLASVELNQTEVRSGALMAALVVRPSRYLSGDHPEMAKIRRDDLKRHFMDIVAGSAEESAVRPEARREGGAPSGGPAADGALARYAVNFTARAREGHVDPVFGRDREIRQMVDILARRRKNNPILVGEAGVGKTAVVEGLALRVVEGDVPELLKGVEIYGIDMGLLQAGAGVKGEFENRLKSVITEIKESSTPIITFIDEAHTLIGAGGAAGGSDAANLLKPALARGELKTVAATTWSEYKKYFEEDPALTRRFQLVKLDEPSADDAVTMLRGLRGKYEEAHRIHIRDDAIEAAARLSARYIAGRQLPDKAVDLLDTACARVKISLSSPPPVMEDLTRRVQSLERELFAVERDRTGGTSVDEERLGEIRKAIAASKEEYAKAEESWKKEKEAVDKVLELRARLEGTAPAAEAEKAEVDAGGGEAAQADKRAEPPAPVAPDPGLTDELEHALAALREIQGKEPLIHMEVQPEVVSQVVGDWTGIPVGKMVGDEASSVLDLEKRLQERIKGQDYAMAAIARPVRAAKAGLQDPNKPMGVFLLVGPSGVGKTETGLAVADLLYGGERFMVTINMSEYQDREMGVSGLVGAKPGYVGYGKGGALTEAVRQRPYSVVLLDEIEKSCTEVRNLFYQVFDKGELTDGTGRNIDFKNTVILVTSNLGSDTIQQVCAASPAPDPEEILGAVRPILSKALQPAWLARTTLVPYLPLRTEALSEIAQLKLGQITRRLQAVHRIRTTIDAGVIDQIAERCTEVETGARNIDYIIQGSLLPKISSEILERLAEGALPDQLNIRVGEAGEFALEFSGSREKKGEEGS
jgi:type VI secretion system protein VasG